MSDIFIPHGDTRSPADGRDLGDADLAFCREAIRHGSLSFHAASKMLPARVRDPALVLYAFCRLADDAVDEGETPIAAVLRLHERLDLAYEGRPMNAPTDRAFAAMIAQHQMPRALPDALLEGLAWDAQGRDYQSLSDLQDYAARVAAVVGAMMCVLMGVRDRDRLSRACDLGLAMQLTNIARDVAEDAKMGRIYLPRAWLHDARITPAQLLAGRADRTALSALVARLLREAEQLYRRSEPGIGALPLDCRPGIFAARHIYGAIGGQIRAQGCDPMRGRARTAKVQKLGWVALSALRSVATVIVPRPATLHARPVPQVTFLVDAASGGAVSEGRSETLIAALAGLRQNDLAQRAIPSARVAGASNGRNSSIRLRVVS